MPCSISELSRSLGLKRDTVLAALARLEEAGLLVRMGRVIVLELGEETVQSAGSLPCPVSGQATVQSAGTPCPVSGQKLSSERAPSYSKKKKERESAREKIAALDLEDPGTGNAVQDEIGYRSRAGPACQQLSGETQALRSPGTDAQRRVWESLLADGGDVERVFHRLMNEVDRSVHAGEVPKLWRHEEYSRICWVYRQHRETLERAR